MELNRAWLLKMFVLFLAGFVWALTPTISVRAEPADNEALINVALMGDVKTVQALLEKGADVNHQSKDGFTALSWASRVGGAAVVQILLENGAQVDLQDKDGWTALMMASREGHAAVVQALVEKGANVDLQMKDGVTALMTASQKGHKAIVRMLLAHGADLNIQNNNGNTALALTKTQAIAQLLKEAETSSVRAEPGDNEALINAAFEGDVKTCLVFS